MKGLKNMKRILPIVMQACMAVCCLTACIAENDMPGGTGLTDGNRILVDLSSGSLPLTRATSLEATGVEIALDHVDVLIFDTDEKMVRHERVQAGSTAKESILKLSARREEFAPGTEYWVYLVANSTKAETEFENLADLNALKALTETTRNIHVTGLPGTDVSNAPQTFLMDGIAYPASEQSEPQTAAPVVLNDASQEDTELKVTLRRAAAKMVVVINKGTNVEFDDSDQASGAGYYLMNMPYTTSLIAGVDAEAALRTPAKNSASYFSWAPDVITVTAYAYAHQWADGSLLETQTRLVVNIPLTYREDPSDPNDAGTFYENSFYQIPVSEQKVLERNHCYTVTVTVNTVGGSDPSQPVELNDISYSVEPWEERTINIGGEDDRPAYLTLNEYEFEMRNISEDHTTLQFVSSSEVAVEITGVYYYDKFGQKQNLSPQQQADVHISAEPDPGLTGKIDIKSDVPTNNTIRYIELKVTNSDDATPHTVTIAQYPLEYITNTQSWYSYRDDFKNNNVNPTTYEYAGDRITKVILDTDESVHSVENWNYEYEYVAGTENKLTFFRSRVAEPDEQDSGHSNIYPYHYTSNGNTPQKGTASSTTNARIYHINIKASSSEYTLGVPRQIPDENYPEYMVTDSGSDNAKLVSPSFMIASDLGGLYVGDYFLLADDEKSFRIAREHCARYVEVYKKDNGEKVVYDDWRLPTEAELNIIIGFQGKENESADAIDYLLNAPYYFTASGRVNNPNFSLQNNRTGIRCIRDAYDDKTTNN